MIARLAILVALSLVGVSTTSAAVLEVRGGALQVFTQTLEAPLVIDAMVEFGPMPTAGDERLVEVRIELPAGLDVAGVDFPSVRLCRDAPGCADGLAPQAVSLAGDNDGDGVVDVTLSFDAVAVSRLLGDHVSQTATLVITGRLREPDRWLVGSAMVTGASDAP